MCQQKDANSVPTYVHGRVTPLICSGRFFKRLFLSYTSDESSPSHSRSSDAVAAAAAAGDDDAAAPAVFIGVPLSCFTPPCASLVLGASEAVADDDFAATATCSFFSFFFFLFFSGNVLRSRSDP